MLRHTEPHIRRAVRVLSMVGEPRQLGRESIPYPRAVGTLRAFSFAAMANRSAAARFVTADLFEVRGVAPQVQSHARGDALI
jgi:hypothetical protein